MTDFLFIDRSGPGRVFVCDSEEARADAMRGLELNGGAPCIVEEWPQGWDMVSPPDFWLQDGRADKPGTLDETIMDQVVAYLLTYEDYYSRAERRLREASYAHPELLPIADVFGWRLQRLYAFGFNLVDHGINKGRWDRVASLVLAFIKHTETPRSGCFVNWSHDWRTFQVEWPDGTTTTYKSAIAR